MYAGNAIDYASDAERIVGPSPSSAGQRDASRYGSVDIGETPRLDIAVGPSRADKYPKVLRDLLLRELSERLWRRDTRRRPARAVLSWLLLGGAVKKKSRTFLRCIGERGNEKYVHQEGVQE